MVGPGLYILGRNGQCITTAGSNCIFNRINIAAKANLHIMSRSLLAMQYNRLRDRQRSQPAMLRLPR